MKARSCLAVAAVLSASLAVVRADRASEQGLIGSLFAPTESYAPVNFAPPRLPALRPATAAPIPAPAPAPAQTLAQAAPAVSVPPPAETFAPAPELASAGPDELVALAAPPPAAAAPAAEEEVASAPDPRLIRINVLDSDAPALAAPRGAVEQHASFDNSRPCGDACGGPSIPARPSHAVDADATAPNIDLRWRKLPCSRPGAYRYQVVNNGHHTYTGVVLYDGEQRWEVGALKPGERIVISSSQPLGPNPAVDHDPLFVSAWDL